MCSLSTVSCKPADNNKQHMQQKKLIQPPRVQADDEDELPKDFAKTKKCYEDVSFFLQFFSKKQKILINFDFLQEDLMELCQRCAKATKTKLAFPMCCSNEDNVTNWCKEYVYYGIQ